MSEKTFKKAVFRDPNHMLFESGYKAFDRQVDLICPGNVLSRVQFSTSIHGNDEADELCAPGDIRIGDKLCAPGDIRIGDINLMTEGGKFPLPHSVAELLKENPNGSFWCYRFMMTCGRKRTPIAWLLVNWDEDRVLHAQIEQSDYPGAMVRKKREAVLKAAIPYLVKGNWK